MWSLNKDMKAYDEKKKTAHSGENNKLIEKEKIDIEDDLEISAVLKEQLRI